MWRPGKKLSSSKSKARAQQQEYRQYKKVGKDLPKLSMFKARAPKKGAPILPEDVKRASVSKSWLLPWLT